MAKNVCCQAIGSILLLLLQMDFPFGLAARCALASIITGLAVVLGAGLKNLAWRNSGWLLFGSGIGIVLFQSLDAWQMNLRIASAKKMAVEIQNACERFREDHGRYPASLEVMLARGQNGKGPYLQRESIRDPWGRIFLYDPEGSCQACIGACVIRPDIYCILSDGREIGNFQVENRRTLTLTAHAMILYRALRGSFGPW
jgi:hypothetical protein